MFVLSYTTAVSLPVPSGILDGRSTRDVFSIVFLHGWAKVVLYLEINHYLSIMFFGLLCGLY